MKEWILTDPLDHDKVIADNIVAESKSDAALEVVNILGYELKEDDR